MKNLTKLTAILIALLLVVSILPVTSNAAASYTLTLPSASELQHGTVAASRSGRIVAGESVTLTFSPESGYSLKGSVGTGYVYSGTYLSYFTYGEGYKFIAIPAGSTTFTFTMPAANVRLVAAFEELCQIDLSVSDIVIEADRYIYNGSSVNYSGAFNITGSSSTNNIVINSGAPAIYLDGVNASGSADDYCALLVNNSAAPTIILKNGTSNTLSSGKNHAGIEVRPAASVRIKCASSDTSSHECTTVCGRLTAIGGENGAGIGGGYMYSSGNVTIDGGHIVAACNPSSASTSAYGAGIGGGYYGQSGSITINGGIVEAFASQTSRNPHGAGIGGGSGASASLITINGGVVSADATSGYGAGIGGGSNGNGGMVIINGGRVEATGGSNGGAGIGGGSTPEYTPYYACGSGAAVRILGGTVNVSGGGWNGNAIGGGTGFTTTLTGAPGTLAIAPGAVLRNSSLFTNSATIQPSPVSSAMGAPVYRTRVTLPGCFMTKVSTLTVSGALYTLTDVYTDEYATLDLYLPDGATVTAAMTDVSAYTGIVTTTTNENTSQGALTRTSIEFNRVSKPVISPANGILGADGLVTITCATPDALIYYTTNGSDPTVLNGTRYTGPFTVASGAVVKAMAIKAGMTMSEIATVNYGAFTSVTRIVGVPTMATVGTYLTLTGRVYPNNSSVNLIIWSISPSNTNASASVIGNNLIVTRPGLVTVRATVYFGAGLSADYTEDFYIMAVSDANAPMAPVVVKNPQNVSVAAGASAVFTVSAVGTAPYTYQWQKLDRRSGYVWVDISGANEEYYSIPYTTPADDNTRYRCQVTNSAGTTVSNYATLTVDSGYSPIIPGNLPDGIVGRSYSTKLTASLEHLVWVVSSGALPAGLTLSADGKVTGTPTVAGTYTFGVIAYSSTGFSQKTLTITIKPSGSEQPTEPATEPSTEPSGTPTVPTIVKENGTLKEMKVGESAVLYVSATAERGTISYQWYCNSKPIEGATDMFYTVEHVSMADNGNVYYCKVTSTLGNESASTINTPQVLSVVQKNPSSCDG